jgi:sulfur-oxidizing protein SoxB
MAIRRRDFLKNAGLAAASLSLPRLARGAEAASIYDLERFGNARILHLTDTHAQLNPVYFREPSVNIGIGEMAGRPPHLVGRAFLDHFGIRPDSADAYAFSCFEFEKSAGRFGKLGGFAHLKTLIDRLRGDAGEKHSLLVDGGDLWQGTGLANMMQGRDMVEAANLLGIEAMTGHWEFTYGEQALRDNLARFKGEFLAQNVFLTEEAAFNDAAAFDKATGRVFKPSGIKELGGHRVAIVGQAFPYVPIAHPKRFTPDWTFGIREEELQKLVDALRSADKVDAVILLSHNGMDVDLKLASRVTGIDVILGGHTHDAIPQPVAVSNAKGATLVTNAGSNGKFLAVLDLDIGKGHVADARYKLLPVYSVFFMILTLASVGLPATSGFTGEFLVLLGAFKAAWPLHLGGNSLPLGAPPRSAGQSVEPGTRYRSPLSIPAPSKPAVHPAAGPPVIAGLFSPQYPPRWPRYENTPHLRTLHGVGGPAAQPRSLLLRVPLGRR